MMAGCLAAFGPTVTAVRTTTLPETNLRFDDLEDGGTALRKRAAVRGSPLFTEYGIALAPGGAFDITWTGTSPNGSAPFLRVWLLNPQVAEVTVTFAWDGTGESFMLTRPVQAGLVFPSGVPPDGAQWSVSIKARGVDGLQQAVLLLDRVEIGSARYARSALQPDAWRVLPAAFLPLVLFFGLRIFGPERFRRFAPAATLVVSLVLGAAAAFSVTAVSLFAWVFFVSASVLSGAIWWHGRRSRNTSGRATGVLACAGILSVAAWLRWSWVCLLQYQSIPSDAIHYLDLAKRMTWPYETQPREPLFMWVVWLQATLTAWGPLSMRVTTFLLSLAEGAALFALSRRFMPLFPAAVVMLLFALNPLLGNSAALGLREELFPLAIMVFLLGLDGLRTNPASRLSCGMATAGAVAAVLTRINALAIVVPLFAIQAWRVRLAWKPAVMAAATFAVLVLPHFVTNAVRTGDPVVSSTIVAHFYRNIEFADKPGFPTRAELETNSFAGAPVSMGTYLFGLHTVGEVAAATASGIWRMTFGKAAADELMRTNWLVRADSYGNLRLPDPPPWRDRAVFVMYVAGFVLCLRVAGLWLVPATILLLNLPLGFLAGKDLLVTRLMINGIPLMLLLAGATLNIVWHAVGTWRASNNLQSSDASSPIPRHPRRRKS